MWYLPLGLVIRHFVDSPCNTVNGTVHNEVVQDSLPIGLFDRIFVVLCPDRIQQTVEDLPYASICGPGTIYTHVNNYRITLNITGKHPGHEGIVIFSKHFKVAEQINNNTDDTKYYYFI